VALAAKKRDRQDMDDRSGKSATKLATREQQTSNILSGQALV